MRHPLTSGGTCANEPSTAADLNETSLEDALINIAGFVDERGLIIALRGTKLIIPRQLQFVAERLMVSNLRVGTADNDVNALKSMGMLPEGYVVNDYLVDTDAFFIKTDAPNGLKHFERTALSTAMDPDFDTGNMRFKARERYSFGSLTHVVSSVHPAQRKVRNIFFKGRVFTRPFLLYVGIPDSRMVWLTLAETGDQIG